MSDRLRPFRDKALSDTFQPRSTFKVITACTALEEKLVTLEDKVRLRWFHPGGRRRFRCTRCTSRSTCTRHRAEL